MLPPVSTEAGSAYLYKETLPDWTKQSVARWTCGLPRRHETERGRRHHNKVQVYPTETSIRQTGPDWAAAAAAAPAAAAKQNIQTKIAVDLKSLKKE